MLMLLVGELITTRVPGIADNAKSLRQLLDLIGNSNVVVSTCSQPAVYKKVADAAGKVILNPFS